MSSETNSMEVDVNSPNKGDDCTKLRNDKIGKVLKKFLDPNFKLKNDVYLNLFLSHLIGKNSIENASKGESNFFILTKCH